MAKLYLLLTCNGLPITAMALLGVQVPVRASDITHMVEQYNPTEVFPPKISKRRLELGRWVCSPSTFRGRIVWTRLRLHRASDLFWLFTCFLIHLVVLFLPCVCPISLL